MGELREVYAAKPGWLRLQGAGISRHIPVAYVSDDDLSTALRILKKYYKKIIRNHDYKLFKLI